jgi:putative acetyltransferase
VRIRAETEADHAAIRAAVEEAFGTEGDTAGLVDAIRASDRFVAPLSLVAEADRDILGHVMSSYVDVVPGRGRVLQVGPLAVVPSHQRQGIGSALMHETIRIGDELGEPLLLIEGNPAYYGRFGFVRADAHGIEAPPDARAPQFFMMRPLAAYDPDLRGRAVYPAETFGAFTG